MRVVAVAVLVCSLGLYACDETFDDCRDGACDARAGAAGAASGAAGAAGSGTAGAAAGATSGGSAGAGPTCTWETKPTQAVSLASRPDGARAFLGEVRVEPRGAAARVVVATAAGLEVVDDVGGFATPHVAAPLFSERRTDGVRVLAAAGQKLALVTIPDAATTGTATDLVTVGKTALATSGAFGAARAVDDGTGGVDVAALHAYPAVAELRLAHFTSTPVDGAVLAMGPSATPLAPTGLGRVGGAIHVFSRGRQRIDHGGTVTTREAPPGIELWAAPSSAGMLVAAVSPSTGTVRLGDVTAADAESFDAGALPLAGWTFSAADVPYAARFEVRQGLAGAFGPAPADSSRLAGFLVRPGSVLAVPPVDATTGPIGGAGFAVLPSGRVLVAWVEHAEGATPHDVLWRATLACP